MFSVFTIADFIASSLEKPFWIALQYFLEKLLDILFWSKLTLGSEVSNAKLIVGLSKLNVKKNKAKKNLNNRYRSITISSIVFFLLLFQMKLEIFKSKIKFQFINNL